MANPTTNRGYVVPTLGESQTTWPGKMSTYFDAMDADMGTLFAGKQTQDDDLTAIAALTTTGLLTRTAANTWSHRTLTAGFGIGITDGNGVAGNPTIAIPTGIAYRAALTSGDSSTITGTSAQTFNKNYTLPAGLINTAGAVVEVKASGYYGTGASPGTIDIYIQAGSTSFFRALGVTLGASTAAGAWGATGTLIVRSTGAPGSIRGGAGIATVEGGGAGANTIAGPVALDTTSATLISVAVQLTVAANTILLEALDIMVRATPNVTF